MLGILKMKFPEGVTLALLASPSGFSTNDRRDSIVRKVYEMETGRDPNQRFETGLARAQWEYGIRGTNYFAKDQRAGVLELSSR